MTTLSRLFLALARMAALTPSRTAEGYLPLTAREVAAEWAKLE